MGEYEAAIKDYTSAMQLSDDKVSLYNHRCGRIMMSDGRYRWHWGHCLWWGMTFKPVVCCFVVFQSHGSLMEHRAYCYAKIGCYPHSVNDYNCVLELDPHNSHAIYNRSGVPLVHLRKGQWWRQMLCPKSLIQVILHDIHGICVKLCRSFSLERMGLSQGISGWVIGFVQSQLGYISLLIS